MAILSVVGQTQFETDVLKAEKPVVVDFWAAWCGPCKMVAPELEAVETEYEGQAVVAKVNVDENQPLAAKYNVMSIPTMIFFKDGKEASRITGYRPRKDIAQALENLL
ncbi:MAG TPA: thioredoxin [Patescibacteria group bacterium]|nr:thioredoxin [Patescibacteria group bacterium]